MSNEFGFEVGPGEDRLEEILDKLEAQESGEHESSPYEGRLEELLDRLESQETGPVFRFDPAPAGCPALTQAQFTSIVRQAINEAIKLSNTAASKLEAAIAVAQDKRGPEAQKTAHLYTAFFCHDPSTPVPWAGGEASGATVAQRFRAIARELGGGRRITFRCDPHCGAHERAHTNQHDEPNIINLCLLFFNPPAQPGLPPEGFRGGVILHEMLHMLFTDFFHHGGPRPAIHFRGEFRRNNAHCFRNFALRASNYGQDNLALHHCTERPC